ncbi:RND superfamily putative drug exporter [Streptomonospora nanhaiensis]|uniref:RND superfamily putative drug exporter n=1 Tax=Streptomonospora nanhaiensis TaxID=1323731 RepID=A0A853BPZ7_9ACTN|nr:MMPL family transporter [Streptomonospora nanhaiensis]NYI96492.1 RND superfamily putative drug exporter [Streptomonospora nanhaiensis]
MATLLYRLGRFAYRHRRPVIGAWVLLLVALVAAAAVFRVPVNDSFSIPGTESQDTVDMLQERFPERSGGRATVVLEAPRGRDVTADRYRAAVDGTAERVEDIDGVESVTNPFDLYDEGYDRALHSDEVRGTLVDEGLKQARADYESQVADAEADALDQARDQVDRQYPEGTPGREQALAQAEDQARDQVRAQTPPFDEDAARAEVERRVDRAIAENDLPDEAVDRIDQQVKDRIPLFSEDGTTALLQVQFTDPDGSVPAATVDDLLGSGGPAEDAGLTVEYSGQSISIAQVSGIQGGEGVGLLVALAILVLNFGALVAAGIPILAALAGTGAGMALIYALSEVLDLTSTAPLLAMMLGLAVGIDYSLFVLSRHRQQLFAGMDPQESAARAIGTAGSAVVFAGTTVVIALLGLGLVRIPFLTVMGIAAAITVVFSVLVAITLLPALLGLLGRRAGAGRLPGLGARAERALTSTATLGARWARLVTRRPWLPAVAVLAVLGAALLPLPDMRLGLPTDASSAPDSTQHRAYDIVTERFGEGYNASLLVTVESDDTGDADEVRADLADFAEVESVQAPVYNDAEDTAMIVVVPEHGPSAEETEGLLHAIRGARAGWEADTGAEISVTGATASSIDTSERIADAMPLFLAVVVGLALVLLMLVFRSVVVPVKAALGFVLSMGAALGATVAVFQWGWGAGLLGVTPTETLLSFLPIVLIGTLFGLAMDYEVFLVSRMREDFVHGGGAREAVVTGYRASARVVVCAAAIMIAVFTSFVFNDNTTIQPVAFALAVGVLVDAFLVRLTLVPAVMALFGRAAWWFPRWLDRLLPDVDIEGAGLRTAEPSAPDRRA